MTSSSLVSTVCLVVLSCGPSSDAWPIEVGWSGGRQTAIRTMLIKPVEKWPMQAWDKGYEAQHRLRIETLLHEGREPLEACLVLNAALGQEAVHSAMVEHDSFWLFKLYRAARVEPNFRLVSVPSADTMSVSRAAPRVDALRRHLTAASDG